MPKLVVISGLAKSGKMPLARKLMAEDPDLVLVHRDFLRSSFETKIDEAYITLLMYDLAHGIIMRLGRSPIIVAWNLEPLDRRLWTELANKFLIELIWLDTRQPEVAAQIPPKEQD